MSLERIIVAATIKRNLQKLTKIYQLYKDGNSLSISAYTRKLHIPTEYAGYLINDGILLRVSGGRRGIGMYKWGSDKPTINLAYDLTKRFNLSRIKVKYTTSKIKYLISTKQFYSQIEVAIKDKAETFDVLGLRNNNIGILNRELIVSKPNAIILAHGSDNYRGVFNINQWN